MDDKLFQTINPVTGEVIETYKHLSSAEIENQLALSFSSYEATRSQSVREKVHILNQLKEAFRANALSLAHSITQEMGKPLKDSLAEVEKCALGFEFYAQNLQDFMKPEKVGKAFVTKNPVGPIFAIMPWNFPLWQAVRFAAPAVGVGNPILLKHSDLTAGTAQKMTAIFDHVSSGLLYNLRVNHEQAGMIIADKRVRGVTLTGSAKAGRVIAEQAGKNLKKSVLELGGNDAYIVLADADIPKAAETCAASRMVNNGQSCISAKRFLVDEKVMADFLSHFKKSLRNFQFDDPMKPETKTGPLAAKKFQKQLLEQCQKLEKDGAEKILDLSQETHFNFSAENAFFPIRAYLVDQNQKMFFEDELFGPVAQIIGFEDEKEAIQLCNQSVYGLGGAVFSKDLEKAKALAMQMESGTVAINEFVQSAPELPFGGVKDSGYGRELSEYGFNEFCNIMSVSGADLKT